jgi:predicted RNA-binding Zn-ribbon protein involved in translation (DUF1610 family)
MLLFSAGLEMVHSTIREWRSRPKAKASGPNALKLFLQNQGVKRSRNWPASTVNLIPSIVSCKLILALQHNLTHKKDGKNGRRQTEITNLHHKRGKIMQTYNQRGLMGYLYALWQAQARHVAWDGIEGITSRGKKGDFAVAIQSLPNNRDQYALFHDWLDDLKHLKFLSPETQIHVVSPFTSAVCPRCYAKTGTRNKHRDKETAYHEFNCKECSYTGNRHSTAAMVEAVEMKHLIEGFP